MSQITFFFGVMSASKTASLLMTKYKYDSLGFNTVLIKPAEDNRSGVDTVASRIGLEGKANLIITKDMSDEDIASELDMFSHPAGRDVENETIYLIDEAQFLSSRAVGVIVSQAYFYEAKVFSYGLLKDFQNKLFDGSQAWIEHASSLQEIKTTCSVPGCGRKATHNLRLLDGNPVYTGEQILIGDSEYLSVCAEHYYNYKGA